jgi:hypothetical protein
MQASDEINGFSFRPAPCMTSALALPRSLALWPALAVAAVSVLPSCTTTKHANDRNCSAFPIDQGLPFKVEVGDGRIVVNNHHIIDVKTKPTMFCRKISGSAEIYSITGEKYDVHITYEPNVIREELYGLLNDKSSPPQMSDSNFNWWYYKIGKSGLLKIESEEYF